MSYKNYRSIFQSGNASKSIVINPATDVDLTSSAVGVLPPENGGAGYTVLYNDDAGTNTNISLTETYTNFLRIGVYFTTNDNSAHTYSEMNTTFNRLSMSLVTTNSGYTSLISHTGELTFSGETATFSKNCKVENTTFTAGVGVKVTKIIGYIY